MARITNTIARTVAPAALLIAASGALGQTKVGTKGNTADVGGANPAKIEVQNDCKNSDGKEIKVEDITITIVDPPEGLTITGIDIKGTTKDHVDDNGDGNHKDGDNQDANEDDTTDSTPGTSCKSIITDGYIDHGKKRDVWITFSETPPPGTKIFIRFSDEDGSTGQHGDLCQNVNLDPLTGLGNALVDYASATVDMDVVTDPALGIASMTITAPPGNPILSLLLPPEVPAFVDLQGEQVFVEFPQPLAELDPNTFRFEFAQPFGNDPQTLGFEAFQLPVPVAPPPCLADFNEDGLVNILDFVSFQEAYSANDPNADVNGDGILNILDFVAFQAAFQQGCPKHTVKIDESFDDYDDGAVCAEDSWETWYINPDGCAAVTSDESYSITRSLRLVGAEGNPKGDDAVHVIDHVDAGQWHFQAWTYVPADAYGRGWITLLNTYTPDGDKNWSLALALDANQGLVQENPLGQQNPPTLPLIVDQWVPIDVQVDLTNDTCTVFYDGQVLLDGQSWSAGMNAPGKTAIEALHLDAGDPFNDGISTMYVDDVRLESVD